MIDKNIINRLTQAIELSTIHCTVKTSLTTEQIVEAMLVARRKARDEDDEYFADEFETEIIRKHRQNGGQ